jgi:hypothetical protein
MKPFVELLQQLICVGILRALFAGVASGIHD